MKYFDGHKMDMVVSSTIIDMENTINYMLEYFLKESHKSSEYNVTFRLFCITRNL